MWNKKNGKSSDLSYSFKLEGVPLYKRNYYFSVANAVVAVITLFYLFILYRFLVFFFSKYIAAAVYYHVLRLHCLYVAQCIAII